MENTPIRAGQARILGAIRRSKTFLCSILVSIGALSAVAIASPVHARASASPTIAPEIAARQASVQLVADVVATPDPIDQAQGQVEGAWNSIELYGPIWGIVLLAYGLANAFLSKNNSQHWLAKGRALSLLTSGSGLLLAALTWEFRGHDTAGLLLSLFLAIKMMVKPTVDVESADASSNGSSGSSGNPFADDRKTRPDRPALRRALIGATTIALAVLLVVPTGCLSASQVKAIPGQVKTATIECAKEDQANLAQLVSDLGAALAFQILSGDVNWSALEDKALARGEALGFCAYKKLVAAIEGSASTETLAAPSASAQDLTSNAEASLDRLRARIDGETTKTTIR